MFFTKKKFEEALEKEKNAINEQWERKVREYDERTWREQDANRVREDTYRRFEALEKRMIAVEKSLGLAEETPICPYAPKCVSY